MAGGLKRLWRQRWLAGLLALAAAACAGPGARHDGGDDTAAVGEVLNHSYGRMASLAIDKPDLAALSAAGLAALAEYDSAIAVTLTDRALVVRHGASTVAEYSRPASASPEVWAALTARAVAELRANVPALAEAGRNDVIATVLDAQTERLSRFSRYKPPAEARRARATRNGYGGIGARLEAGPAGPILTELRGDAPAAAAGLRAGMVVLAVEGRPTAEARPAAVAERLRGEVDSPVTLTVAARRNGPLRTVTLERARIVTQTVAWAVTGGHAYIEVKRFNAATARHLRQALGQARRAAGGELGGVILDLRGNPGGILEQAVQVADLFLSDGPIVRTRGRHPGSVQHYRADGATALAPDVPLIVLVDGMAASASEIVGAALQDGRRAVLVGTTSYGKGTVQTVSRLPNDGALYLTWSRIYTPTDYTLARLGVLPNLCVPLAAEQSAEALVKARLGGETIGPGGMSPHFATWRTVEPTDRAAKKRLRAICPPQNQMKLLRGADAPPDRARAVADELLDRPRLYSRALAIGKPSRQIAAY